MQDKLLQLKNNALATIKLIKDKARLEEIENKLLGRKSGELTELLKGLKELAVDTRKVVGQIANEVKTEIELALQEKKQKLKRQITFFDQNIVHHITLKIIVKMI